MPRSMERSRRAGAGCGSVTDGSSVPSAATLGYAWLMRTMLAGGSLLQPPSSAAQASRDGSFGQPFEPVNFHEKLPA